MQSINTSPANSQPRAPANGELSQRQARLIARLHRRKTRTRDGLFLAEGVRCAGTVLDAETPVRLAVCSAQLRSTPAGSALRQRLADSRVALTEVSERALGQLAGTDQSQGLLLVCEQPRPDPSATLARAQRVLIADRIQDPGNLGTLVRSAAAFGLDAVVALDGTVDPFNPKAVRASAGAVVQVPVVAGSWEEIRPLLGTLPLLVGAADGFAVVQSQPRWALVLGNEAAGARDEILAAAAEPVAIPMAGAVNSLNASVAGAILMYALSRPS